VLVCDSLAIQQLFTCYFLSYLTITGIELKILTDRTSNISKTLFRSANSKAARCYENGAIQFRGAIKQDIATSQQQKAEEQQFKYKRNRNKVEQASKRLKSSVNEAFNQSAVVQRFVIMNTDADYTKHSRVLKRTLQQHGVTGIRLPCLKKVKAHAHQAIKERYGDFMPQLETVLNQRKTLLAGKEFCHQQLITITRIAGSYQTGNQSV
jgi:hypothetical protein